MHLLIVSSSVFTSEEGKKTAHERTYLIFAIISI